MDVTNLKADGSREQRRADSAETARTRLARGRMLRRFAAEEVLPPWM